jgi:CO/xanthine dehydrogenase Mo-binding subunit
MNERPRLSAEFGHGDRVDAEDKTSGRAAYCTDIAIPGMLHAKLLRSPLPHARIKRIDVSQAASLPGVHAVLTGDTLPARILSAGVAPLHGFLIKDQPIVAADRARYAGDIIAAVAADSEAAAVQALQAIEVEYEELPFVASVDEALKPTAPQVAHETNPGPPLHYGPGAASVYWPRPNVCFEFHYQCGSPDTFASCDYVFEDEFCFSRMNHFHLEPFVSVARASREHIELWSSTQMPFPLRGQLSQLLKIPENRISVRVPFVGGAFGAKAGIKTEAIAIVLSMMSSRPVRLCYAMEEDFLTSSQHAAIVRLRTGVMRDGTLVARASEILLDAGAYADVSPLVAEKAAYRAPGPYRYRHLDSRCSCVMTNTTPAGAFRGFGGTQATWASESQVDMIARRLGIDPLEMRRKNLLRLGEALVPGESGIDSDLGEGLELVAKEIDYGGNRSGPDRGVGLAVGLKDAATSGEPACAHARVKITTRGDVLLQSGAVEMGQGLMTSLSQIAAEILGTSPRRVRHAPIDTDATPFDRGTIASVGVTVNGKAVELAAQAARKAVLDFAASRLGCPIEELALEDWSVRHRNETVPLVPLIMQAFGGRGHEFTGEGVVALPGNAAAPFLSQCTFWEIGWAGAEVEVDRDTGRLKVTKLVVSGDAGRAINHLVCRGQDEGAAAMAYGQALFERMIYRDGRLANGGALAYRVPLAEDLPAQFIAITQEQGHGPGPFGAKGMGEGGMLPIASAIANAVEDAVGVRITSLPITPEKILRALEAVKRQGRDPI